MILLASLRSDKWTAWSEHVVDFIGPGNQIQIALRPAVIYKLNTSAPSVQERGLQ